MALLGVEIAVRSTISVRNNITSVPLYPILPVLQKRYNIANLRVNSTVITLDGAGSNHALQVWHRMSNNVKLSQVNLLRYLGKATLLPHKAV
jgi:hypothetical protein